MKAEETRAFHYWFDNYVSNYYRNKPEIDEAIRLKDKHSRRVAREMRTIARALSLPDGDIHLAETVGLFHDLGRFPQWQQYGTFNDARSVDHGKLSIEAIEKHDLLAKVRPEERDIVKTAVEWHNKKTIPKDLLPRQQLFSEMIRDADKIDIWRVEIHDHESRDFSRPILSRLVRGEFPDTTSFSTEIYDSLMRSQRPSMRGIRSAHDFLLFRLSWVFDINFAPAARSILEKHYIEKLLGKLPPSPKRSRLQHHLLSHLQRMQS